MAAVGQDLARDLALRGARAPLRDGAGCRRDRRPTAPARPRPRNAACRRAPRRAMRASSRDCSRSDTNTFERHSMSELESTMRPCAKMMDQPPRQHMRRPRRLGIARVALHPLADEVGGERARRHRRPPARAAAARRSRAAPLAHASDGGGLVEDRAVLHLDRLAVEAEACRAAAHRHLPDGAAARRRDGTRRGRRAALSAGGDRTRSAARRCAGPRTHAAAAARSHLGQETERHARPGPATASAPQGWRYWRRNAPRRP